MLVVGAALLRLAGLNRPTGLVFDEIFYAQDACVYVVGREEVCGIADLASRAHPPLGKWLIGAGIALFGYQEVGWRIGAAVAGTVTVPLVYLLGWRLLRPVAPGRSATIGALAAAGLLATDFLHVVQSRIAMLDVFITLFVVGAALAIVLDRDRPRDSTSPSLIDRLTLGRPWRLVAGACLGAAAATKWSGAYVALAIIGLTVAWEIARTRADAPEAGWWRATRRAFRRETLPTVILLGLVPLAVYLASYTTRMSGELIGLPWVEGTVWRNIWEHQAAMLGFHTTLGGQHPYESPPWSWGLLKRPVAYFFEAGADGYREILALGNPIAWWPGLLAGVAVTAIWLRRGRDLWQPELLIAAAVVATYGPWLALSGTRSQVFLWYLLPTLPFLYLALGMLAAWAWQWVAGRVVVGLYGVALAASFLFWFPVLAALPLDADGWRLRVPFRDCERPGAPTLTLPDDDISEGPPPAGWCWI